MRMEEERDREGGISARLARAAMNGHHPRRDAF